MQREHGVYALLRSPRIFDALERIMGYEGLAKELVQRYLRPRRGDRVLDVGCGTADIAAYLPETDYMGIEPNEDYVAQARRRYGDRFRFRVGGVEDLSDLPAESFDLVMALGVLHHVDDASGLVVFQEASRLVGGRGRLVTIDPCFTAGQSRLARCLVSRDRGRNVKHVDGYRAMAVAAFAEVRVHVRHDLVRLPWTHCILECSGARPSASEAGARR